MSTTATLILGAILAILGAVILYHAIDMKKNETVSEFFISEEELKHCKDKKGLCNEIFQPILIFGIICIAFAIEEFVSVVVEMPRLESAIAVGIFLVAWFWFSMKLRNAKAKYCQSF